MIKSKCCNAEVETGGMGDFEEHDVVTCYHQCTSCKNPCDVVEETPKWQQGHISRPVDDKLKEAAKKAAEVFEEEEKTDFQRLEEKVDKLGEMVAILLNDRVDKVEDSCSPNFWTSFKFK
ncbi:hypothetical protein KBA63_00130 [Candidatus Woesebacteria bacterium]|nr:hypothetical protein [Candidatus Woesebacteria bacterium]